jgi:hypothetical protein
MVWIDLVGTTKALALDPSIIELTSPEEKAKNKIRYSTEIIVTYFDAVENISTNRLILFNN